MEVSHPQSQVTALEEKADNGKLCVYSLSHFPTERLRYLTETFDQRQCTTHARLNMSIFLNTTEYHGIEKSATDPVQGGMHELNNRAHEMINIINTGC